MRDLTAEEAHAVFAALQEEFNFGNNETAGMFGVSSVYTRNLPDSSVREEPWGKQVVILCTYQVNWCTVIHLNDRAEVYNVIDSGEMDTLLWDEDLHPTMGLRRHEEAQ